MKFSYNTSKEIQNMIKCSVRLMADVGYESEIKKDSEEKKDKREDLKGT